MKNRLLLTTLLLSFLIGPFQPVSDAESVPISVLAAIEVNGLTSSWTSAEKEKVIADLRQLLSSSLKKKHPHWDFRNDDEERICTVMLRVVDPDPDDGKHEAEVRLEVTPGDNDDHWPSHYWLDPVDFQFRRFPKVHSMARRLAELFEFKFLENRTVEFRKWLQETIPLAKSGEWRAKNAEDPNFQIVLSLPYETFESLKASLFRIKGKPADGPVEKLRAVGISDHDDFTPVLEGGLYQGLVVQARSIEENGQTSDIEPRVHKFILGPVFLLEEVKSRDQELALFEEDGS